MNIIEFNGESCTWCKNRNNCTYNSRAMNATREAVRNISCCTKAYCSAKVTCDYYIRDNKEYTKHNECDCCC